MKNCRRRSREDIPQLLGHSPAARHRLAHRISICRLRLALAPKSMVLISLALERGG